MGRFPRRTLRKKCPLSQRGRLQNHIHATFILTSLLIWKQSLLVEKKGTKEEEKRARGEVWGSIFQIFKCWK